MPPGPSVTSPWPTSCGRPSRPTAGSWRRRRTARRCAAPGPADRGLAHPRRPGSRLSAVPARRHGSSPGRSAGYPAGFWIIWTTVALDLVGFGIVVPILGRYAERYGASGFEVGLLVASFSAAQFVCSPLLGRLSDRIGRKPV